MIGGLALLCLALMAALTFEAASEQNASELQLDLPTEHMATQAHTTAEPVEPETQRDTGSGSVYSAEPSPISTNTLTALEQAAEEPLENEFNMLLQAIQQGFGESSAQIAPSLRPYAFRLAGRLNIRPDNYRVRVSAPIQGLAETRAETLGRLFEAAGVVSSRITFHPRTGIHSLVAEQS